MVVGGAVRQWPWLQLEQPQRQRVARPRPRPHDQRVPPLPAVDRTRADRGHNPGPYQRGLARARGAHHGDEAPLATEHVEQLGFLPLASEHPPRIGLSERLQPAVGPLALLVDPRASRSPARECRSPAPARLAFYTLLDELW